MEKIIEVKECKKCSNKFNITDKDLEFFNKISPEFSQKKYQIPSPTFCPNCRIQRKLTFRNERNLYKRTCDLTNKSIISIFSPDKKYIVYNSNDWWEDSWDPIES
jgi:Zn ribbon nucleic-acid-binding protein